MNQAPMHGDMHGNREVGPHFPSIIWRWTQSTANSSLPELPRNRERYSDFSAQSPALILAIRPAYPVNPLILAKSQLYL